MPHAKTQAAHTNGINNEKTMASTQVTNGDGPQSQFLSHLTSYPVVSDGISTYKSNPYGAKSLNLVNHLISIVDANFYKPISPYLATPISYVAPYVAKADSLGDQGLSNLESKFPFVKEDTSKVREKAQGAAFHPVVVASEKKDALLKVYGEQVNKYQKQGYGPVLKYTRAMIDTDILVLINIINFVADSVLKAQKQAGDKFDENKDYLKKNATETKDKLTKNATEKKDQVTKTATEKKDQLANSAIEKKEQFKNNATN